MPNSQEISDWTQWSQSVLKSLETAEAQREKLDKKIEAVDENVTALNLKFEKFKTIIETKSAQKGAVYGAVTSLIITIIAGIILYLLTGTGGE